MVLNGKELSFEKKRLRRRLPGSAAESEVRPPNMGRFWERFWPPKALFKRAKVRPPNLKFGRQTCMSLGGTLGCRRSLTRPPIKSPQIGNGRVFSPFSSSEFSSLDQVLGTWRPKELVSPISKLELAQTLDLQEVSVDLCFPLCFMKFLSSFKRF
ncbi:hypothetical protein MANES_09G002301v8 [Manihot esculenta]|uniref:Uncharacterized protein n=1 Tax=Manihot esculenta TaxID=3983 RepID=A0ACB7H2I5_MANES|nr:hypothetical protein MANES_09G002301v8 [Manihot esculenta]